MLSTVKKNKANVKNPNCNSVSTKMACCPGTYWAGIKDTCGESQTMMS